MLGYLRIARQRRLTRYGLRVSVFRDGTDFRVGRETQVPPASPPVDGPRRVEHHQVMLAQVRDLGALEMLLAARAGVAPVVGDALADSEHALPHGRDDVAVLLLEPITS